MTMTLERPESDSLAHDEASHNIRGLMTTESEMDVPDGLTVEVFGGNIALVAVVEVVILQTHESPCPATGQ